MLVKFTFKYFVLVVAIVPKKGCLAVFSVNFQWIIFTDTFFCVIGSSSRIVIVPITLSACTVPASLIQYTEVSPPPIQLAPS